MRLVKTIAGLRASLELIEKHQSIGLVPTMGALHQGHKSLIKQAKSENEVVVVSIFVNPLQFGPGEDWHRYPSQLERDCQVCEEMGLDLIFAPNYQEMGLDLPGEDKTKTLVIPPPSMTQGLCAPFRPIHFQGVTTIVTKLFNLVRPHQAYFGEKDAQQLAIIKRLVEDLNLDVVVKGCPTVRETSGLACSSRNQYLSDTEKAEASNLYRSLQQAAQAFSQGECRTSVLLPLVKQQLHSTPSLNLEYLELVDPITLSPLEVVEKSGLLVIAAWMGRTRLIDNLVLKNRLPLIAIDGPAGAGKSTVTRYLAQKLDLLYLDTGAMYRAVTWWVLQSKVEVTDQVAIAELINDLDLEIIPASDLNTPTRVFLNQNEVTHLIRSLEVTSQVSTIAAQKFVRRKLIEKQRQWGEKGGLIAEGRDIGTNIFPDADLKIFLTASTQARAQRRLQDLAHQGVTHLTLEQLEQDIQDRDQKDSNRSIAPLQQAADAVVINTDHLSVEAVTDQIIQLYHQKVKFQGGQLQLSSGI